MKKLFVAAFAFLMMAGSSSAIDINLNGTKVETDVEPYIVNGRTMVPLSTISKGLESQVEWENISKTATIKKNGKVILVTINNKNALVDGHIMELDAPAEIKNDRTMVPISFITKALGIDTSWDNESKTVILGDINRYHSAKQIKKAQDEDVKDTDSKQEKDEIKEVNEEKSEHKKINKEQENMTIDNQKEEKQDKKDNEKVKAQKSDKNANKSTQNLLIKWNINYDGEKIYHMPDDRDYFITIINESKGERWFKTAQEAEDAGWKHVVYPE